MSWIQKLYETYERCANDIELIGPKLWPVSHVVKQAHVEVVLDINGNLKIGRIRNLDAGESDTLIPTTENSASRAGAVIAPHPLCDEVSYCAPGSMPSEKFSAYIDLLSSWAESMYAHPKSQAVLAYVKKCTLRDDLIQAGVFPLTFTNKKGQKTKIADEKVFIRWRIETVESPCSGTWQDSSLIQSWQDFDRASNPTNGVCMVTGQPSRIAKKHARFVRYPGDGGKLISTNDSDGYTFRGKFTDGKDDYGKQAYTIGFDATQKAHNALRWLINRQGYRKDYQAIVSWAVSGASLPDPIKNSFDLLEIDRSDTEESAASISTDQNFALRLKKAIAGYGTKLEPNEDVVVIGLDSATPGRMAISFYRELKGSDFLARIESWHTRYAWHQNYGKETRFIGAPAPPDIAEAAYGRRLDEKLKSATVERLLPCIIDGWDIPLDLVRSVTRRATNRVGLDHWEWEKVLGIACALLKGYHTERNYQMSLELERKSRDYLYGRLLAIADSIEGYALSSTDEGKKRETTAGRLMQRFADRPFSTWRTIELALKPYEARMQAGSDKSVATLIKRRKLLDDVMSALDSLGDRTSDAPLSGEFLLGYHSQRKDFWPSADADKKAAESESLSSTTNQNS